MTALLGFFILGERIAPLGLLGMLLIIGAIIMVILYKNKNAVNRAAPVSRPHKVRGAVFAFLGALGQSGGLILSKIGAPSYDPIAATQIRVIAGFAGFFILAVFLGKIRDPIAALRDRSAVGALSLGAFFGPFLGVSLGLFAVQRSNSGIAATLMGLTPILILLPSIYIQKERLSLAEGLGAVLAVSGAALIFI